MKKSDAFVHFINRYNYENPKFHKSIQQLLDALEEVKRCLNQKSS
jgi:hypothetical protein